MLVVHPHFHPRRTGVTAHTEVIVSELARLVEARGLGRELSPNVPRIEWGELWRRLRSEPVVWHAHRNNELLFGFLLKLIGRQVELVYTRHGPFPPSRFTRLVARGARQLVTLNRQGSEWIQSPSTIVSHGVDLTRFCPPPDREAAWRGLGLPGKRGIGVVGRIRPNKGQGDFVKAVTPLLEEHPEWTPVLVGLIKGPEQAWVEQLRRDSGDRLQLAGEQKNVAPWYQGFDILVHPSYGEAYSMVLIEALAAGCCVVATALPHHPEVIDHGRTGFLYEPGDVDGLRDILRRLMSDPELVRQIGRNAAEEARRRFGVEHEAAKLARLYREALGQPALTAGT